MRVVIRSWAPKVGTEVRVSNSLIGMGQSKMGEVKLGPPSPVAFLSGLEFRDFL